MEQSYKFNENIQPLTFSYQMYKILLLAHEGGFIFKTLWS